MGSLIIPFFASCQKEEVVVEEITEEMATAMIPRVQEAFSDFSGRLLQDICERYPDSNVSLSPFTAHRSLSLLRHASDSLTRMEIINSQGYGNEKVEVVNRAEAYFFSRFPSYDTTVNLRPFTSLWIDWKELNGGVIDEQFINDMGEEGMQLFVKMYDLGTSLSSLNKWGNNYVGYQMPALFDELPDYRPMFTNEIISFTGGWSMDYFGNQPPSMMTFRNADGTTRDVEALKTTRCTHVIQTALMTACAFRFGVGCYRFVIVMPETLRITEFIRQMAGWGKWDTLFDDVLAADSYGGELTIPVFKVSNKLNLRDSFFRMGVHSAYDPQRADFSSMSQSAFLSLGQSYQHSVFMISQKGVDATYTSGQPLKIGTVVERETEHTWDKAVAVDRPFLFFVLEESTKSVIYSGKIEKM